MNDFVHSLTDEFESIYFVEGQRNGRYPYSHSLLIGDSLFDTGISSGFIRKLKRKVDIKNIFLSHWHEDHISGNRLLPSAYFHCHPLDKPIVEDINLMYEFYFVKYPDQAELFTTILKSLRLENIKVDKELNDNDSIDVGDGLNIQVIHTPGHSAGHCCFFESKSKVAFLADIDLSSFGPWYAGLDSSLIDFENSIKKMMKFDIEFAVTSHKGVISGTQAIKEGLKNYLNVIYERDELILSNLMEHTPKSSKDLRNKNLIYKYYTEYELYELMAEEVMIQFHFDKFLKEGKIESKDNGYILS